MGGSSARAHARARCGHAATRRAAPRRLRAAPRGAPAACSQSSTSTQLLARRCLVSVAMMLSIASHFLSLAVRTTRFSSSLSLSLSRSTKRALLLSAAAAEGPAPPLAPAPAAPAAPKPPPPPSSPPSSPSSSSSSSSAPQKRPRSAIVGERGRGGPTGARGRGKKPAGQNKAMEALLVQSLFTPTCARPFRARLGLAICLSIPDTPAGCDGPLL